ncbi:hypothetical protein ABEB36_008641 [Hypothenemus hampei]|uniref:MORN repeat-containing protein 5 n=1 Tax=Hypothenemus hampei TaxID=57062 RepID=A0ABD1EML0_HYPHA
MISSKIELDTLPPKKVQLDFSNQKRISFLPGSLYDDSNSKDSSIKVLKDFSYLSDNSSDDILEEKRIETFCTGSKYLGQWNKLGMAGKGIYKFPHGVIYDGYFNKKGEFHGAGILVYPNGQKIEGIWRNGRLGEDINFVTNVGNSMNKNYCMMPDRRFQIEIDNNLNPSGHEYLTNELPPPRNIPYGCYDLVEGFYNPKLKTVYSYPKRKESKSTMAESHSDLPSSDTLMQSVSVIGKLAAELEENQTSWIPSAAQEAWIVNNCRRAWDEPIGFRPDLYEEWTKGDHCIAESFNEEESSPKSLLEDLQLTGTTEVLPDSRLKSFIQMRLDEHENKFHIEPEAKI